MTKKQKILKSNVDVTSMTVVLDTINCWINNSNYGKYICLFNVHMCMEAFDDNKFLKVLDKADLILPDGFPIYLAQKFLGHSDASRIRGADLTVELSKLLNENNTSIGFIGGTKDTLDKMSNEFFEKYHINNIKYSYSPPFRSLTFEENNNIINDINNSGIKILFVGLGCPKQEIWMYEHKDKLNCIMIGVGAAFDFISGNKKTALYGYKI